jgi:ectoine hydroxylase-related dioxygenase (phytanoyl-CoA dioxygenase family)
VTRLRERQIEIFRRDGFLFPVRALEASSVAELRAWFDGFERAHADLPPARRHGWLLRFKPHLLHPELDRVVRAPAILDAVEDLIGPDLLVWASAFFVKDPGDPSFVSWHQDSGTYGLDGDALVTAWIAVGDVDAANGAMRFLPGGHAGGPRAWRATADPANMLSLGETIDGIDEGAAVDVVLRAGEMSLHHVDLPHASPPNRSPRPRIGYAVRYMAPSMRPRDGVASALLVRGRDRLGNFELEAPPDAADAAGTTMRWERAMALREGRTLAAAEA